MNNSLQKRNNFLTTFPIIKNDLKPFLLLLDKKEGDNEHSPLLFFIAAIFMLEDQIKYI